MKKILAALLCELLCLTPVVQAESTNPFSLFPTPSPEPDNAPPTFEMPAPTAPKGGSMRLSVLGQTLTLDFDDDPMYSMLDGGYIQASFYGYDASDVLYELYLLFPDDVSSGSVVTPESSTARGLLDDGIILYVTSDASELYAIAAQDEYGVYPEETAYAITFDEVTRNGSACTFSGSVEATLMALDDNYNALYPVDDLTATFQFTMELESAPVPDFGGHDSAPRLPGLVTPPDAQKI